MALAFRICLCLCSLFTTGVALEVVDADASNSLYLDWLTPQLTLNPNNVATVNGIDVSGVGWGELGRTGERHVTLVSATHVLLANHFTWAGPVHFFSPAQQERVTYYIGPAADRVPRADGTLTDVTLAPIFRDEALTLVGVDSAHGLAIYPLASSSPEAGEIVYPIGFGGDAGSNSVRVAQERVEPLALQPVLNTEVFYWSSTGTSGEAFVVSGDSGSPTLTIENGQTVLLGMHIASGNILMGVESFPASIDADLSLLRDAIAERTVPLRPVEAWRWLNFGDRRPLASGADEADPDGDAMENLLEYAFGTDPNAVGLPSATFAVGVLGQPGIRFPFVLGHDDLIMVVEASDFVGSSWSSIAARAGNTFLPTEPSADVLVPPDPDPFGRQGVWVGQATSPIKPRGFFRVRVGLDN